MTQFPDETSVMRRALELAALGEGRVEPNPMVGAVLVDQNLQLLGEGYHQQFGGPHAEVHALQQAGERARGAMLFVTLEPCCHHGKTPPCAEAVVRAGIRRVVVAATDPNPRVAGGGVRVLREAGIAVETGLLEAEAVALTAPFRKWIKTGRPWVIGKWAMTLDGKIASRTGASQWISGPESRATVHQLRGRVDGIVVGIGTALADDPQLTARPAGVRVATRIVLDRLARLPVTSQLVKTAREVPVLVCTTAAAPAEQIAALAAAGVEVVAVAPDAQGRPSLPLVLDLLGARKMTNVLVEGGGQVLGTLFDQQCLDEVHVYIAPKLLGGLEAPGPVGGVGLAFPAVDSQFSEVKFVTSGADVQVIGRLLWPAATPAGQSPPTAG